MKRGSEPPFIERRQGVLFCDEAFWAGDKAGQASLQTLITEHWMPVEAKGVDLVMRPNHLHLIIGSEQKWIVPAGEMERRLGAGGC